MKAHKIHFPDIFWSIFGILGGNFGYLMHFGDLLAGLYFEKRF